MAKAQFHWGDSLLLNQQLTDDEHMVRDAAHKPAFRHAPDSRG